MTVTVIDVAGADAARLQQAIEALVAESQTRGEIVLAMTAVPGSSSLAVVTGPGTTAGPAEQLEHFKRLKDEGAIGLLEFDEITKRLIASL